MDNWEWDMRFRANQTRLMREGEIERSRASTRSAQEARVRALEAALRDAMRAYPDLLGGLNPRAAAELIASNWSELAS